MANNVFFFYYAPTWDFPPGGPIKLGNILTSIKKPDQPLHTVSPPNNSESDSDPEVYSSEKTEVEYSNEKFREGKFSILTKFLSVIGAGVDLGVGWKTSNTEVFKFDRVQTDQFLPNDAYLQQCLQPPLVRSFLERSRYRKPIYIITGIKTVYGSQASSHSTREHSHTVGVAVDGTVWSGGAVPVGLEPTVEGARGTTRGTAWGGSSDFVFAFRVREVRVAKKTQEVRYHEDYRKGAMLGHDEEGVLAGGVKDVPELSIVSVQDYAQAEEDYDEEILIEGDAFVPCAFPREREDSEED